MEHDVYRVPASWVRTEKFEVGEIGERRHRPVCAFAESVEITARKQVFQIFGPVESLRFENDRRVVVKERRVKSREIEGGAEDQECKRKQNERAFFFEDEDTGPDSMSKDYIFLTI